MIVEIIRSSEGEKELIHKRLQDYNAQFMKEFSDFSCHIEESGTIVAGIVAESVGDIPWKLNFSLWRRPAAAVGWARPCWNT